MKRKRRSDSKSRKHRDRPTQCTAHRRNPFSNEDAANSSTANDESGLLSHVLKFLELSKVIGKKEVPATSRSKFFETLQVLEEYVESSQQPIDASNSASQLVSPKDVAEMLVPWASKLLVQASGASSAAKIDQEMVDYAWTTMATCLDFLFRPSIDVGHDAPTPTGSLSGSLSQSVLNKLAPFAVKVAFSYENSSHVAPRCFEHFVDRLYRPTLNVACESVLLLVEENYLSIIRDRSPFPRHLSAAGQSIIGASFRLLRHVQEHGVVSPKKTFEIFSEAKVIRALARLYFVGGELDLVQEMQQCVREVLWEGLFGPSQHMDGFMTLNLAVPSIPDTAGSLDEATEEGKGEIHCYQEHLLVTLKELTLHKDCPETEWTPIVRFIPTLLKGFVEQSLVWEKNRSASFRGHKGKSKRDGISAARFRFWTNLAFWLLARLERLIRNEDLLSDEGRSSTVQADSLRAVDVARALRATLVLVLENDLYLSTHDDKDGRNISFLDSLTSRLSRIARGPLRSEILGCIDILVRLNHHTIHDKLSRIILLCAVPPVRHPTAGISIDDSLFLTVVSTYQQLRLLDYLIESMLTAFSLLRDVPPDNDVSTLLQQCSVQELAVSLGELVKRDQVAAALSCAVEKCPPGQLPVLFEKLSLTIKSSLRRPSEGPDRMQTAAISFVASLLVLLVRNAQIDSHTAPDMIRCCTEAIEHVVSPSLENTVLSSLARNEVLFLFGWLFELRTRCLFWLDSESERGQVTLADTTGEALTVLLSEKALREAMEKAVCEKSISELAALQFLAFYQVQYLHSQIYKEGRTERDSSSVESLIQEATRLVAFAISCTSHGQSSDPSILGRWTVACQLLPYWVPFAASENVDEFLNWLFSSLAAGYITSWDIQRDRKMVLVLTRDASFYESYPIACRIRQAGIAAAATCVRKALSLLLSNGEGELIVHGLDLTAILEERTWTPASSEAFSAIISGAELTYHSISSTELGFKSERLLRQAHQILLFLNGLPTSLPCQAGYIDLFDAALRMYVLSRWIASTLDELSSVACDLLCSALALASQTLVKMADAGEDNPLITCEHGLRNLVLSIFSLPQILGADLSSSREESMERMVTSGIQFLDALVVFFGTTRKDGGASMRVMMECIAECCGSGTKTPTTTGDSKDRIFFVRSLIRRMALIGNQCSTRFDASRDEASRMLCVIRDTYLHQTGGVDPVWSEELLLLASDMACLSSKIGNEDLRTQLSTLVITELSSQRVAYNRGDSLSYYLASLVTSNQSDDRVTELVLKECLKARIQVDPLLESAFCVVIREMQPQQVLTFSKRLHALCSTQASVGLRLFELILTSVDTPEQCEQVAACGRQFFMVAVKLLCRTSETDEELHPRVSTAASLIMAMLQNRDILRVRERDIALLLAQTSALLGHDTASDELYSCCFDLSSLLLQRFPRQLYSCAPSIISVLHSFLRHAITSSDKDDGLSDRSQKFVRLCELLAPHSDVYRKHVLGILLEFVGAIRGDIDPQCKKSLLPGIFCLLDMLTHYETKQLNAMMDTTGKALFRTVHQSYQKQHQYKGQY